MIDLLLLSLKEPFTYLIFMCWCMFFLIPLLYQLEKSNFIFITLGLVILFIMSSTFMSYLMYDQYEVCKDNGMVMSDYNNGDSDYYGNTKVECDGKIYPAKQVYDKWGRKTNKLILVYE